MKDEAVYLTPEEAEGVIVEGEEVHTFVNSSWMLVGADWSRAHVLKLLRDAKEIQRAGEMATRMGHGIGALDEGRWVYIATDPDALAAFDARVTA